MRLIQVVLLLVGFGGTSCRDEKQYVSKFRSAAVSRAPRASQDEFSTIINQLAVSARLITAITLQNGLIDGSIPSDKALAELLNIESVDLAQIESFDKKKVDEFIGKLKALGSSISAANQVSTFENMVLLMNKWRVAYEQLGDFENTSAAVPYLKSLKTVKTANLDYSFLDDLVKASGQILNHILSLGTKNVGSDYFTLPEIHRELGNLLQGTKKLQTLMRELDKLKSLPDHKFTDESSQRKFVDLLDDFFLRKNGINVFAPAEYQSLVNVLSSISVLVPDAKNAGEEIKIVGAVFLSKSSRQSLRRQYTSGLNDFTDVGKLSSDVDTLQFKEVIHGFDTSKLRSGLRPLQSLMINANVVEKNWAGLFDADSVRVGRLAKEICEKFKTFGTVTAKTAGDINSCATVPQGTSNFYKGVAALFKNVILLRKQAVVLFALTEKLSKSYLLSNTTELFEMKNTTHFSSNDTNIVFNEGPGVLAKFKKLPINNTVKALGEVKSLLEEFKNALGSLNIPTLVQQLPAISSSGSNVFSTFFATQKTREFKGFFEKLKKVSGQLESASSAIELTRNIREVEKDSQFTVTMNKLSKTIDQSRMAVKTLRSASAALKGNLDPEVQEITKLKGLEKEAGNFGTSVMALDHVRHVLKEKDHLETFLEDGDKVEEEIGKVQNPQLQSELKEDWGVFEATKHDVSELIADLETRRDQMTIPKASKFADYGSVFNAMNGLKDVDLQVENRLKVLETLGATNQTLNNMKAQLEQLKDLDLQFARFNKPLSTMTATLDNLDKMFKSLSEANGQRSGSNSSRLSDSNSDFDFLYILILIGIVAFVIIGGILLWIFCKKRKGKKTAKKDGAPIVQNATVSTSTTTQNEKKQTGEKGGGKKEKSSSSTEAEKVKKADPGKDFTPKNDTDRAAKIFRELCWDYRNEKQVKEDEEDDRYGVEHNGFDDLMKLEISDKRTLVEQWYDKLIRAQPHTGTQIANNNRFLGGALRFCLDTQPDSNKDKGLWYPANIIKLPMWSSMIVAQGPMSPEKAKDDTRPAFWHMTFANLVEHIVMVCGLKEVSEYFPTEVGTSKKYGDYEVTLKSEDKFTDSVDTRVLIVVNSKTKEERRVKHWNITSWPQGRKLPENGMELLLSMVAVLNATRMQENPVIVHGTDSTGRAAAYAGAEYIFQKFFDKAKGHPTLPLILAELRAMCSTLFKHGFHLFYAGLAGCYCLNSVSKMQVISQFTLNLNYNHYLHFFEANGDLDAKDRRYLEKHKKNREMSKLTYGIIRPKADKTRDATVEVSATDLRPTVSEAEGAAAKASTKSVDFDKTPVEEVQSTQ